MRLLRVAAFTGSMLIFVAVLERLSAAISKMAKFDFDWNSPIYLNTNMVLLFCAGTSLFCVAKVIWMRRVAADKRGMLKWSITLDFASCVIVGGMLVAGLAKITP